MTISYALVMIFVGEEAMIEKSNVNPFPHFAQT